MKQPSQLTVGNDHSSSRYFIYPSSDDRVSGRLIIKWFYRSCDRRCFELAYLSIPDDPGLPLRYGPYYAMSVVLLNKSFVRGLLSGSQGHQISVIGGWGEGGYDKLQMRGSAKPTPPSKTQICITNIWISLKFSSPDLELVWRWTQQNLHNLRIRYQKLVCEKDSSHPVAMAVDPCLSSALRRFIR